MADAPSVLALPKEKLQRVSEILNALRRLPGVDGASLARMDGIMVAQVLNRNVDHRRVASISAGLVQTANMAAEEIGRHEASHTIVATVEGDIVVRNVGEDFALAVILRPEANLGLVLLHIGRASEEMRMLLADAMQ